jgi:antidote-toxin recognition MazE-like antitoxin
METRASSRDRIGRHHAAPPERRLRPVMPWLQDVNDPDYRARLAEECRHLADLTPTEVLSQFH